MNVPTRLSPVLAIAALLYAPAGLADDSDVPMFTFHAFGTFGLVYTDEKYGDFTGSGVRADGAGYSSAWSYEVDSLLAGQIDAQFTTKLSAVLQVISQQTEKDTFMPQVEWANLKYQFTPDFSLRVGRTVLPVFQFSDTRKVGFTYPWVRPPLEVYQLGPITTTDGADVSYRLHFGDWTHTLQLRAGVNDTKLPHDAGTVKARSLWGISNTTEFGALTAHVAYVSAKVTVNTFDPLFDAFRQFGPQGVAIADANVVNGSATSFLAIGASYDPGKWFAMSEWGRFDSDSALGKRNGWYLSGGYRFGKLTPFITYASADADHLSDPGLDVSTLPPFLVAPAMSLNAGLNGVLRAKAVEDTISIGARWDFAANFDIKLQLDHIKIGAGSIGILTNIQPDFPPGGTELNVFSATIDFVY